MIIGRGDVAQAITDREDRVYFASGVSNSQEQRPAEYQREIDLLLTVDPRSHLVYFSSLCVFYAHTRYARHKRYMEQLVRGFERYTIVRLGNITWGSNPHTLINTLRAQAAAGQTPTLRDEWRYVCDRDEFRHWLSRIPSDWSCEINIPGRRMKVAEIYQEFVMGEAHVVTA